MMVEGLGRAAWNGEGCCWRGLDMLLLWWPGDWALWSSGDEADTLPVLGECIEAGTDPPDRSRGSHVVPGLRLWRLEWDIVVSAVEVTFWFEAAEAVGYE